MTRVKFLALGLAAAMALPMLGQASTKGVSGDYMEFRNADVYTGPCFANGEMGLGGKNALLAWRIHEGTWQGVSLNNLSVIAVVRASDTLGDRYVDALPAKAVVVVDQKATPAQRDALVSFAKAQAGKLLADVVAVQAEPITFDVSQRKWGSATVKAGKLVELKTRAVGPQDVICHNEEVYYKPLASHLEHAVPAVEMVSSYTGNHLNVTWQDSGRRSSFVAAFSTM